MSGPVSPNELGEISSRLHFRQTVGLIAAGVLVVWMVVFILLAASLINSSNHAGELATRSDCKTQYTSILTGPVTARDNLTSQVGSLNADLNSQLGTALLNLELGQQPSTATVAHYAATKANLDAKRAQLATAIGVVEKEPSLNAATTKGFHFDGRSYPPCAIVK